MYILYDLMNEYMNELMLWWRTYMLKTEYTAIMSAGTCNLSINLQDLFNCHFCKKLWRQVTDWFEKIIIIQKNSAEDKGQQQE